MASATVQIKPPNMKVIVVGIKGNAPLVVHRYSDRKSVV
jgi:hypothetical protein